MNTKLHLAVDAHGMPVRMAVTAGMLADCTPADRGYDTSLVLAAARERGMTPVILPKRSRKTPQSYDEALYQARYQVENCFRKLKGWRGVATRYAKKVASYLAICRIRALALWAKVI